MSYVITCGDEGVQINEGTRLGIVGAGFQLPGFSEIVGQLKKLLGDDLRIAASEENDWIKQQLQLSTWEQTNASAQQQINALSDQEKLLYVGFLPFADPKDLKHDIRGHMVRPHTIHIATQIAFSLDGGEQKYHLGQFMISAEWVSGVKLDVAREAIKTQVEFYQSLVGGEKLPLTVQTGGELGEKIALKNKAVLEKLGYAFTE